MLKVKYTCLECNEEEEKEVMSMFLIYFDQKEGEEIPQLHVRAHHVDTMMVLEAVVQWIFNRHVAPDDEVTKEQFVNFLKGLGVNTDGE